MKTQLISALPADGLIDAGTKAMNDTTTLFWAGAAAAVAFFVFKGIFSSKTFMSAVIAIAAGLVLIWGINAVKANKLDGTLTDTVTNYGMRVLTQPLTPPGA